MKIPDATQFLKAVIFPRFGLSASFLTAISEAGAVIGGSTVLQAILGCIYADSDMDIYFSSPAYKDFMHGFLIAHNYERSHTPNVEYPALDCHSIYTYTHVTLNTKIQLIYYKDYIGICPDIAATGLLYKPLENTYDLNGHSLELLKKHITYMCINATFSSGRFRKYRERGWIILQDKPVILDCCESAPLLRNEYEFVQEADLSTFCHSGRYFNLY